jgi:outer membrane receptor protein involved in Fe transport
MAHRISSALLGSISLIALTAPVYAASESIETVVVTASKRPEQLKNVPMSVTVVSADTLEKLNARGVEDLLATVPGFSVTEANPTHPDLILRGINAGGVGTTVASYIDETPFGSSSALANGGILSPNLDPYDLARVEVLRGPQGTLYGASTEGGLIKYVTNAPDPTAFAGSVELGGVDLDHGGSGGSARAMANIPLGDNLAVRASLFYVQSPGYIDNAFTGAQDTNDLRNMGGRVSLLYQPIDKVSVRLTAMAQDIKSGNTDSQDVVLTPDGHDFYPKYGDYIQQRTTNEPSGVRDNHYNATVNWDLDWASLVSSSSYGVLHDFVVQDGTAPPPVGLGADIQGFVSLDKFTQEIRLASDPGQGPFEWLVGGFYTLEDASLHQDIVTSFHGQLAFPGSWLQLDSSYNEIAAFANATYHFTPSFDVSVGGRYASSGQHAHQFEGSPALGDPAYGDSSENVFTWSATARYHLNDDTMIYGRVAKGFRPGGPNVLPPNAAGVPTSFDSDSLIDYEIGTKVVLPESNLSFDASVFLINWDSIQLLTLVQGFGINGNGGTARSEGAEANVTWTPIDRVVFNLNGAFTDAHLTQNTPDPVLLDGRDGDPLPWSPKWSVALSGDYRFLPMGSVTPYLGATLHYVGTRHSDFVGDLYQLYFGIPGRQFAVPGYAKLDLRAGVDWNSWNFELYVKNLNDAKGINGFAPYGVSAASAAPAGPFGLLVGAANVTVMPPRLIGGTLRWKF